MTYESHHSSFSSSVGSLFRARGAVGSRKSCVVDSSIHGHVGGIGTMRSPRDHTRTQCAGTHWRSEGGAGRTGRHLLGAANGRKLFLKIHVNIHIV